MVSAARFGIVTVLGGLLWMAAAGPLVPACALTAAAAIAWCYWLDRHPG